MTRTARTRKHQGFDLETRLAPVEAWIERNPSSWRGRWRKWVAGGPSDGAALSFGSSRSGGPAAANGCDNAEVVSEDKPERDEPNCIHSTRTDRWREVHVDLGCGKGEFAVGLAQRYPDVLFVGIDSEPVCAMHGGEVARAAQVDNAVFTIDEAPDMLRLFGPHEVNALYLNFSTPHPKRKHAAQRLTYVDRLIAYRQVLASDGFLFIKTDSAPFMQFTRNQLALAGYTVVWETDDCQRDCPDDPRTQYEQKLVARGAKVLALKAVQDNGPIPRVEDVEQTEPLSLYAYLPDDLESLTYIPHGMTAGVENERYRRRREAEKNGGVISEFWTRA